MAPDPLDTVALTTCADADLLALHGSLVADRRALDARLAAVAAEIARRSAPDAGMAGLARSSGDRTPEKLVERLAGVDAAEARRMIAVGARVSTPDDVVGSAVLAGTLSVAAAAAITTELDRTVGELPAEVRAAAEADLVAMASTLAVSELRQEARARRDDLDVVGVPEREERLRRRRRLCLHRQADGMTRIDGLLDPESAALVTDAFDQALSPRRGGPRFVDPGDAARADALAADPRTTEQLMLDVFVEIVRIAVGADPGRVFGSRTPAVRVHVTEDDLHSGTGYAILEGQSAAVSIATAERLTCRGDQRILFDSSGRVLDLGREQRLFSGAQRRALAARDGGCLVPGCDRPPSWTEAHHIDEWGRHRGRTDLARGVLLCAHHHRWIHAHRHRVVVRGGAYGMIHGTTAQFVPWPSKNPLRSRHGAGAARPATGWPT